MNIKGYFKETDKLEATISITMPISDWKKLKDAIPETYPFWKISSAISEMVYKLEKVEVENIIEE